MCARVCVCVCVYMCVCVCPVGMSVWLVVSYESSSLLPAGGDFKEMKAVTLSSLQVKSYLPTSTTGNINYDFIRLLAGYWSLAGALGAISLARYYRV